MIAAAITRRLKVDPLIRTYGAGGGISATGTADSNSHKISHYGAQLGCHIAFVSLPLLAESSLLLPASFVYSPSIPCLVAFSLSSPLC
jgi:hypothetical protein